MSYQGSPLVPHKTWSCIAVSKSGLRNCTWRADRGVFKFVYSFLPPKTNARATHSALLKRKIKCCRWLLTHCSPPQFTVHDSWDNHKNIDPQSWTGLCGLWVQNSHFALEEMCLHLVSFKPLPFHFEEQSLEWEFWSLAITCLSVRSRVLAPSVPAEGSPGQGLVSSALPSARCLV